MFPTPQPATMTTTHEPDSRRETQDHALVQSVDRVLRALKGWMDEQASARNVDDFLQAPVLGTEDTMAINRRQKNDRELAAFVRIECPCREAGKPSEYSIPFTVKSRPCSTRPTSWTVPSHGLRISGVSAGMGRYSGFTPRVNTAFNDR